MGFKTFGSHSLSMAFFLLLLIASECKWLFYKWMLSRSFLLFAHWPRWALPHNEPEEAAPRWKSIATSRFKTLNFEPLITGNTLPPLTRAPVQPISMQLTHTQPPFTIAPSPATDLLHCHYNNSAHQRDGRGVGLFIALIIPALWIYQKLQFYYGSSINLQTDCDSSSELKGLVRYRLCLSCNSFDL